MPFGTRSMVRCTVVLVFPCRSRTCRVTSIGTSPSESVPPERNEQSVPGVNATCDSARVTASSLPATANVQRNCDGNPVDRLASNTQSTAPADEMITQESSPRLADVTRNCASSGGGVTVSVVDIRTPRYRALMVTTVVSLTVDVLTVKALVVSPAATETLAGTLT